MGSNVRSLQHESVFIRRMLTENTVRASDRRARFIGADLYRGAGGIVMRDLFEHDDGGWLPDLPLLDRLVTEKLQDRSRDLSRRGLEVDSSPRGRG